MQAKLFPEEHHRFFNNRNKNFFFGDLQKRKSQNSNRQSKSRIQSPFIHLSAAPCSKRTSTRSIMPQPAKTCTMLQISQPSGFMLMCMNSKYEPSTLDKRLKQLPTLIRAKSSWARSVLLAQQ